MRLWPPCWAERARARPTAFCHAATAPTLISVHTGTKSSSSPRWVAAAARSSRPRGAGATSSGSPMFNKLVTSCSCALSPPPRSAALVAAEPKPGDTKEDTNAAAFSCFSYRVLIVSARATFETTFARRVQTAETKKKKNGRDVHGRLVALSRCPWSATNTSWI